MKFFIIVIISITISGFELTAQNEYGNKPPKTIFWENENDTEVLKTEIPHKIRYFKIDRENYYMKLTQYDDTTFNITLKKYPTTNLKFKYRTKSVFIPKDGSSPIAYPDTNKNSSRVIAFSALGDRDTVYHGELVNIEYDNNLTDEKIYIAYESFDRGYYLELTSLHEMKRVKFNKLCQIYIVATPELTTVEFSDDLRYEQIVWTPREDNSWEVRIGTTGTGASGRGCNSEALQRINKLRTEEYEDNLPR